MHARGFGARAGGVVGAALGRRAIAQTEAAYVVLGPQGPVARAVLAQASGCLTITIDGAQQPMSVRALPDAAFPVLVCERTIPAGATSASLENSPLPLPRPALKSIAAFGDTGCRLKSAKDSGEGGRPPTMMRRGANSRTATIPLCGHSRRWPRASRTPSPTSSSTSATISIARAPARPGDAGCARSPYGDDWPTWKADFSRPRQPALLAPAPWIVVRGNHESAAARRLFPAARSDAGSDDVASDPPCIELVPHFTVTPAQSFIVLHRAMPQR